MSGHIHARNTPQFDSVHMFPLQTILISTTFSQDLVQIIVLTSYSIQCYLLRRYLLILKKKLLQNTIDPLDWMRVNSISKCQIRSVVAN